MRVLHPLPAVNTVAHLTGEKAGPTFVWTMASNALHSASAGIIERQSRSRLLALKALSLIDDRQFRIETNPHGKPVVVGATDRHIAISHSGDFLVAAAAIGRPIGIDVERHKASRNIDGIAEAAFGPSEREAVNREGPVAFYRIWTIREALAKATGEGIMSVTDRQDRVPPEMPAGMMVAVDDGWLLGYQRIAENMSWALALRGTGDATGEF